MTSLPSRPILVLSLALFLASLLLKIGGTLYLSRLSRSYTYLGSDYPQTWPIHTRKPVLMSSDNSLRFRLDSPDGANEWAAIVPPNNALIHLGPHRQPFSLSLFHQLRCLDVIRADMTRDRNRNDTTRQEGDLARHCLNYIKQMVLCRGDLQLEPFQYASHKSPIDLYGVYHCNDWGAVYDQVHENQREYAAWKEDQTESA
ncbi:hypothetical protein SERLA73DRAFT_105003 [Serpula lacrymans var. lacrymans S7.3]|uniref:Oxidase ustYa n=2 Tax=Serpula lacrymans var. lacrymans TaxID=341189 RepID=F8PRY9_SERL3|nr:uncharacterized protein SERLADRAFT_463007 [Serpula lacrymans var. lacrymans S7.9]EGO00655.1 hypothetical protein SERLA73DRAFT_105003 [Serpula lacrymans var. lacrymans S7.3]EGO26207.1 hypothetical protein SERLADRAFT_463007 [Serpula lacrymans var. lacrymans S7.9]